MPRFVFPQIIPEFLVFRQSLVFWLGSEVTVIRQQLPWLQFAGLIVVFVTGLADAIYRVVTKRSFFK
ncbi:hypothetical protein A8704_01275 [Lactiplantibacillus plantarum]|nr:hypothetical protein A8704_01275 [Lactiplantibacillus plantarum]MCT3248086.1 hypothetical protein [Lactiplantibacillus plantarum]